MGNWVVIEASSGVRRREVSYLTGETIGFALEGVDNPLAIIATSGLCWAR